MTRFPTLAVFAIALTGMVPISQASVISFHAPLNGASESPPNASPGVGFAEVDYDDTGHTLHVHVDFSGLTGPTTASHIHSATLVAGTGTAGVATTTPTFAGFPIGVTSGTYDNVLDLTQSSSYNPSYVTANGGTTASAEQALVLGMLQTRAYLNIHSSTFPGGEIRGFLVPEPGTLALLGFGALLFRRRR